MIEVDWTIWIQFANFFVLMAVLNFLLYRPLRGILNRRRETIDGSYAKAKELEAQINEKMERYQEQLQAAKLKGNEERAEMRKAAAGEEAEILGKAQAKATAQLQEIKSKVAGEADAAAKALKKETEGLASQIASKVLGRAL
ncbi:ATP synthase F0 subunit B [Trichloromonas sp.]|uniref:ATP synthase F0 subunit B n=1 Tax=Trichloromonas sp. TaxID=3069249 RepID=UPI003D819E2F